MVIGSTHYHIVLRQREVIIEERIPSAGNWMIQIAVGMFAAQLGFVVLEKARKYVGDYI